MQLRLRDETRRAEIGHELADVLYFVLLMSANLGYDVSTILRQKLELSAHNYPVEQAGYDRGWEIADRIEPAIGPGLVDKILGGTCERLFGVWGE